MPFVRTAIVAAAALTAGFGASAQEGDTKTNYGADNLGATTERFTQTDGADLYKSACSGCHGPEGDGAYGAAAYPPLAGNPRFESPRYPVNLIIEGNGAMPSFADWLDDEQVAAVTNFLRTNLGNSYEGSVTADTVARMRKSFADLDGG